MFFLAFIVKLREIEGQRVDSGSQLLIVNCRLSIVDCQLSIVDCRLSIIGIDFPEALH